MQEAGPPAPAVHLSVPVEEVMYAHVRGAEKKGLLPTGLAMRDTGIELMGKRGGASEQSTQESGSTEIGFWRGF